MSKTLSEPVRICLITGYLGAGKTTLLNHILSNQEGVRAAVIVNDIGEVNIDAELLEKSGSVSQESQSLIPLSNGCICCTLADDLAKQLTDLAESGRYQYVIIEASGICEPIPIAQTITMVCRENTMDGLPMQLDNVAAVVDCSRMLSEFENGRALMRKEIEEDDIENLLIQQIEFCNTLILNKTDLVTDEELAELKALIHVLQRKAVILEAKQGNVPLSDLLFTNRFKLDATMASAGWVEDIQKTSIADKDGHHGNHDHASGREDHDHNKHDHKDDHHDHDHKDVHYNHKNDHHDHEDDDREDDDHEHGAHSHEDGHRGHDGHHHHHHHHHDESEEMLEYGIETFVYKQRRPFIHERLEALCDYWPHSIIRCKGMVWYAEERDMSFIFEQAGRQITESPSGRFLASAPKAAQAEILRKQPGLRAMWDPKYGDRMIKLVFIGRNMDKDGITALLNACLGE